MEEHYVLVLEKAAVKEKLASIMLQAWSSWSFWSFVLVKNEEKKQFSIICHIYESIFDRRTLSKTL